MKIDFINTLFKNRESAEATASHSRAWQVSSIYPYLNMPSLVTSEQVETCDFFFQLSPRGILPLSLCTVHLLYKQEVTTHQERHFPRLVHLKPRMMLSLMWLIHAIKWLIHAPALIRHILYDKHVQLRTGDDLLFLAQSASDLQPMKIKLQISFK